MKSEETIQSLKKRIKELETENALLKKNKNLNSHKKSTVKSPQSIEPIFEKAEQIVGDYFKHLTLEPQKGSIKINDERYVLVRASALSHEFLHSIMHLYEDRGKDEALAIGKNILFDIGHVIGIEDAKVLHEKMDLKNPIEKLSAGPVHFAYSGWASVEILPESNPSPDENFFLKYNHPYSFEADAWINNGIKSNFSVCTMNAAYSSGWCQQSFGIPLTAVEITCRAKGDKNCTFIMAPPSKIESYLDKEIKIEKLKIKPQIPFFFERKLIEERIQKNENLLKSAQKLSKLGSWEFDLQTQDLFWSDELYHIYEIDASVVDNTSLYNEYISRFHQEDLAELYKCIEEATTKGKQYTITHRIILPNGNLKWIMGSGTPLKNDKGDIIKLTGYAQDITEKIKTEIELNQFFKLSKDLLCLANIDGYFLKLSEGWRKVLGYTHDELTAHPFIYYVHPDDINITTNELSKLSKGKNVFGYENRYRHKDGSYRILSWNAAPDKKTGLIYCIVRDVTIERESEQKLRATLHEKEILLKEIHHRVKNNLQIISSLLKLHADKANDTFFSELVEESQNRIISMSLIHEMLYANSDLSKINLTDYTSSLFDKLKSTYNKGNVHLKINIPTNFYFEVDKMISIGLIMNELFSNSFKYAFNNHPGNISVELTNNTLIIADDGIGISDTITKKTNTSFGLQLIDLLADQIDSKVKITKNKGTRFEFAFN